MGRKAKYENITDRWMNDKKWTYQDPFMIGTNICWEEIKGTGKNIVFEHYMFDTKNKSINQMICSGVPTEAIRMYKFLMNIDD